MQLSSTADVSKHSASLPAKRLDQLGSAQGMQDISCSLPASSMPIPFSPIRFRASAKPWKASCVPPLRGGTDRLACCLRPLAAVVSYRIGCVVFNWLTVTLLFISGQASAGKGVANI